MAFRTNPTRVVEQARGYTEVLEDKSDSMSSLQTVQRLMVEQFGIKPEDVGPDSRLESLGMDSLSVIEFMFKLEDELKIELPDERVEVETVGDIANYIDSLLEGKSA